MTTKTNEAKKTADMANATAVLITIQETYGTASLADLLAETTMLLAEIEDAPRAAKKMHLAAGILAEYARKA